MLQKYLENAHTPVLLMLLPLLGCVVALPSESRHQDRADNRSSERERRADSRRTQQSEPGVTRSALRNDYLSNMGERLEAIKKVQEAAGNSPFKEEVDAIVLYMSKTLANLVQQGTLRPTWGKIVRGAIGQGLFRLKKESSKWYFYGFKEGRVVLRGKPPKALAAINEITLFGFDTIGVELEQVEDCVVQRYRIVFPRVMATLNENETLQEIVMAPSYRTEIRYCNGSWDSFSLQFFKFMEWWSCSEARQPHVNELLAQLSWYIAFQMGMHGSPYDQRASWCDWCKKYLEDIPASEV